jgi:hypothetical protein
MAKLQEDVLVVKISKLIKDSDDISTTLSIDLITNLEAVVQELAGAGALVEIEITTA